MLTTHCLCTKLRRAARSVTRVYDDALHELGLNVAQYSLLSHLQRLEQPSISVLAEAMGLDRSTLGRNLKVLEGEGLVQMGEGSDLRARQVQLTAEGLARYQRGATAWQQAQAQLALRLGAEKREALWLLLDDLVTID
jgi:DNA-binding MarR family transcriptional regulator